MAQVILGASTMTTTSGSKGPIANVAVGDLILLITAHTDNTATVSPTDSQSGTYTLVTSLLKNSSLDTMQVWVRDSLITSAASATFTHNPGTTSGGGVLVFQVTGMRWAGLSAIRQVEGLENQGSGTPEVVFPTPVRSLNARVAALFYGSTSGRTPATDFTEEFDSGYSTPTASLYVMSDNVGSTSDTVNWGSAVASPFCALVVELEVGVWVTASQFYLFNSNSGSKSFNANVEAGDLMLAITAHTGNVVEVSPTDTPGSSYSLIRSQVKASGADKLQVWVRNILFPTTTTYTFTHNPGTTTGGGLMLLQVTGMTRAGVDAIRQSAGVDNQGAGTPEVTLGSAVLSANPAIGMVFSDVTTGVLPASGFTEGIELSYTVPNTGLQEMHVDRGFTGSTITWGSSLAAGFCALTLELDTTPASVVVTLRGTPTFNTNSGSKTLTMTPAIGELLVVITAHTGNTSAVAPTDNNSSGTYTEVTSAVKSASADTMRLWVRNSLIASATSTIITHAPGVSTGGGLAVYAIQGISQVGAAAVRQVVKADNQGVVFPTVTFGTAGLPSNPVLAAVFSSSSVALTPPMGFVEDVQVSYATPTALLECCNFDLGFSGTTLTWSENAVAHAVLAVELATSVTTPLGVSGSLSATGTRQQRVEKLLLGSI